MKRLNIGLFIFVCTFALPTLAQDTTQIELTQQQQTVYRQLQTKASNLSVSWDKQDAVPKWVRMTNLDINWRSADYTERAYQLLEAFGSLYKIEEPNQKLNLKKIKQDDQGMTHITLQQEYQGIPVYAGQLQFHFRANGSIASIGGNIISSNPKISSKPTLTPQQAKQIAEKTVRSQFNLTEEQASKLQLQSTESELYFYNYGVFSKHSADTYLVWTFSVYSETAQVNQLFYINAHDGSVVNSINNIQTSKDIDTLVLADCADSIGTSTYDETSSAEIDTVDGASTDAQAWEVNGYAGLVYDYYYDTFSRDSYNDTNSNDSADGGATLWSYTHYEVDGNNDGVCEQSEDAAWYPIEKIMRYGEDYITLDVTGHELTHAVIQYSVGTSDDDTLTYEDESGALNESYADVFGEFIEFENGGGDWLHREDYVDGANRSLENPDLYGQPDHWSGYVGGGDVHINSGIPNKAAYLLTEGGEHHSVTVSGIGTEAVEQIYYRVLTQDYLNIASDFSDAYQATLQSCIDLYESDPVTYPFSYCESVYDAFTAVGIDTGTSYINVVATAIPESGYAPLTVDFDGADSISLGGTITDYEWDLDSSVDSDSNGSVVDDVDNTGPLASSIYSDPKTLNVRLTITDNTGNSSYQSTTITVNDPLEPTFSISGDGVTSPAAVSFDASGTVIYSGAITNYTWNFGDGTTASSGTTATTNHNYTSDGYYTVTLTITTDTGYSETYSHMVYVGSGDPEISGTLSNDTWSVTGGTYVIDGLVTIADGATLTIEPGTVIKFSSDTGKIIVYGNLVAQGTSSESIIFTSYYDDSYGGDTNGDGSATSAGSGDWKCIEFMENSGGTLSYTVVQNGGYYNSTSPDPMISISSSDVTIKNSYISASEHNNIEVVDGSPAISFNTITSADNSKSGINVESGSPLIENNTFTDNAYGITVPDNSASPVIVDNIFTSNTFPIYLEAVHADTELSGNTGSSNVYNGIFLSGQTYGDVTLTPNNDLVYINDEFAVGSGDTAIVPELKAL